MTTVAAIDCGTNSIRLLISTEGPQGPEDVVRKMEIIRLGEGIDTTGRISPAALSRTSTALEIYGRVIDKHQPDAVRMVATSATRDAENADAFADLVMARLGVTPEVISGDEEAQLSFAGAVADLPDDKVTRLVVDIGGGSTEFVRGIRHADAAHSVNIGCVRMTERHLASDPPTPDQIAAAESDILGHVDTALAIVDPRGLATSLVGLAGSVTTVTALALGLDSYQAERIHHAEISYDQVAEVTDTLLRQSRRERLTSPVMHPGRADVIGAGALVLRIIMERTKATTVTASEHDILDGIAASIR